MLPRIATPESDGYDAGIPQCEPCRGDGGTRLRTLLLATRTPVRGLPSVRRDPGEWTFEDQLRASRRVSGERRLAALTRIPNRRTTRGWSTSRARHTIPAWRPVVPSRARRPARRP